MKRIPILLKKYQRVLLIMLVVLVVAGGGGIYYSMHRIHPVKLKAPPVAQADPVVEKRKQLVASVQKQIDLPVGEDPRTATVSDKNTLPKNDFFALAENGDKLLLYPINKKVYLYRPSLDRVIAVAPLTYKNDKVATGSASPDVQASSSAIDKIPQF